MLFQVDLANPTLEFLEHDPSIAERFGTSDSISYVMHNIADFLGVSENLITMPATALTIFCLSALGSLDMIAPSFSGNAENVLAAPVTAFATPSFSTLKPFVRFFSFGNTLLIALTTAEPSPVNGAETTATRSNAPAGFSNTACNAP